MSHEYGYDFESTSTHAAKVTNVRQHTGVFDYSLLEKHLNSSDLPDDDSGLVFQHPNYLNLLSDRLNEYNLMVTWKNKSKVAPTSFGMNYKEPTKLKSALGHSAIRGVTGIYPRQVSNISPQALSPREKQEFQEAVNNIALLTEEASKPGDLDFSGIDFLEFGSQSEHPNHSDSRTHASKNGSRIVDLKAEVGMNNGLEENQSKKLNDTVIVPGKRGHTPPPHSMLPRIGAVSLQKRLSILVGHVMDKNSTARTEKNPSRSGKSPTPKGNEKDIVKKPIQNLHHERRIERPKRRSDTTSPETKERLDQRVRDISAFMIRNKFGQTPTFFKKWNYENMKGGCTKKFEANANEVSGRFNEYEVPKIEGTVLNHANKFFLEVDYLQAKLEDTDK